MSFSRMKQSGNNFHIAHTVAFNPISRIPQNIVESVLDFSYQMTFAHMGEHRDHRTGGTHHRKMGEIFACTFQGKLAEFAVFQTLREQNINVCEPDLTVANLGVWDSGDLVVNDEFHLSIKSTKSYGNLLLLETSDWDNNADYIPDERSYDFTFLVRMKPFCEEILKRNRLFYSNDADYNRLHQIISENEWKFDIPGFITRDDLIYIIRNEYVIPQGAILNDSTRMDASNYYVHAYDMRPVEDFCS